MSETEKIIVTALMSALAFVGLGFLLHTAPRFPGSLAGGIIGIAGAMLLVLLLIYSLVKRAAWLKQLVGKYVKLGTILSFHVYAGVVGALLGIIHSGHKFQSPLGIALVSTMLIVVFSGFVGRYYLVQVNSDLREQNSKLALLRSRYDAIAAALGGAPLVAADVPLDRLLNAIADEEYGIRTQETLKRSLSRWTILHISVAIVMYSLLALHIWNGIYYGLRWLG